jgi:membrane protein implicated in regulation of membrane protease activity
MEALNNLEPHFVWLAIGLILLAAEMAVPGVFLMWMGLAALVVGFVAWVAPIGLFLQIVLFAFLAILAVFTGRRYLRDNPIVAADPMMNRRADRVVGEIVVVTQAIDGGAGKVKLGDSEWLAKGADAQPGTKMRVTGHDGVVLTVEPVG